MTEIQSGFRPQGEPITVAENRWFSVVKQPMDFVDSRTGLVKAAAANGAEMNYVQMTPGALIVAVDGNSQEGRVVLAPQERHTTNLLLGRVVVHYELPGGAFDNDAYLAGDREGIVADAAREFGEEVGMEADSYHIVGPVAGHPPHPSLTDSNVTIVARGARFRDVGSAQEANEIIGGPEWLTWEQTEEMYLTQEGLYIPGQHPKVISSAPTIASLNLAQRWLHRQEQQAPIIVDLASRA